MQKTYSTKAAADEDWRLVSDAQPMACSRIDSRRRRYSPMGGGRTLWRWTDADIAKGRKVKATQKPGPKADAK